MTSNAVNDYTDDRAQTQQKPLIYAIRRAITPKSPLMQVTGSLLLLGSLGVHHNALALDLSVLDGANGFTINGLERGDKLGSSIKRVGDVNGDGFADALITDDRKNFIVFSRDDYTFPANMTIDQLDGDNGFAIEGDFINFRDHLDLNGDGLSDLLLGGFVIFGRNVSEQGPFEKSIGRSQLNGENGFRIVDGFTDAASQGDISGDGLDDIAFMGDSEVIINGYDYIKSSIYVILGQEKKTGNEFPADFVLSQMDGENGFVIDEASLELYRCCYNSSNHFLGDEEIDIDGDGVNELMRIDTYDDYRGGSASVIFNSLSALAPNHDFPAVSDNLNNVPDWVLGEGNFYGSGGVNFEFAGDVNIDGKGDLSIIDYDCEEFPHYYYCDKSAIYSTIVFGSTSGLANSDKLNFKNHIPKSFGDLNGDGINDLFYMDGSPTEDGISQSILFGRNTAAQGKFPDVIDKSYFDGVNGFNLSADIGVLTSGDFNGDGIDDVIASLYTPGASPKDAANVYVLFGRRSSFPQTLTLQDLDSSTAFKIEAPEKVNSIDVVDINADGSDDIIIGIESENNNAGAVYFVFGTSGQSESAMLACPGDVDGNGSQDLAVLVKDNLAGTVNAEIKDLYGNHLSTVKFNNKFDPTAFKVIDDINNNQSPELVVIDRHSSRVQVRDALTGRLLNKLRFHANGQAIDIEPVTDQTGSGAQALASLNNLGKVNIKDALNSQSISQLDFSTNNFKAEDLAVIDSLPPNFAVLAENKDPLKLDKVTVRDSSTGRVLKNLWYGKGWDVLQLEMLADQNGNGSPESAVLRERDSRVNVMIRDSRTGKLINSQGYSPQYRPVKMAVSEDINGNGSEEIVLLGYKNSEDRITTEIKDASTNATLNTLYFNRKLKPLDMAVCADMNGNNKQEIVVLGERKRNGELVLVVKDAKTGQLVGKVDF